MDENMAARKTLELDSLYQVVECFHIDICAKIILNNFGYTCNLGTQESSFTNCSDCVGPEPDFTMVKPIQRDCQSSSTMCGQTTSKGIHDNHNDFFVYVSTLQILTETITFDICHEQKSGVVTIRVCAYFCSNEPKQHLFSFLFSASRSEYILIFLSKSVSALFR